MLNDKFSIIESIKYSWQSFKENMAIMSYLVVFALIIRAIITLVNSFIFGLEVYELHQLYINTESFADSLLNQTIFNLVTTIEEFLFLSIILVVGVSVIIKLRNNQQKQTEIKIRNVLRDLTSRELKFFSVLAIHKSVIFLLMTLTTFINAQIIYTIFAATFKEVYVDVISNIPLHINLLSFDVLAQIAIFYLEFRLIFAIYYFLEGQGVVSSLKSSIKLTEGIFMKGVIFQLLFSFALDLFILVPFVLGMLDYVYQKLTAQLKS